MVPDPPPLSLSILVGPPGIPAGTVETSDIITPRCAGDLSRSWPFRRLLPPAVRTASMNGAHGIRHLRPRKSGGRTRGSTWYSAEIRSFPSPSATRWTTTTWRTGTASAAATPSTPGGCCASRRRAASPCRHRCARPGTFHRTLPVAPWARRQQADIRQRCRWRQPSGSRPQAAPPAPPTAAQFRAASADSANHAPSFLSSRRPWRLPPVMSAVRASIPGAGSGRPTARYMASPLFGRRQLQGYLDIRRRRRPDRWRRPAARVVYRRLGALKGYGELVIIKHDEQYLSAYGYNRRRLVEEGQQVLAGQPIAELGLGPEQRPLLHFEIRDRGKPIDPLPLLPRRWRPGNRPGQACPRVARSAGVARGAQWTRALRQGPCGSAVRRADPTWRAS